MFTGFASENTPAIQVWDFSGTFASSSAIRSVSLSDDCAPIQYFKTGGATLDILVYLPTAPTEGKQITIVNSRYTNNNQLLSIRSSDKNQNGASADVYSGIGPGQTLRLVYSKEFINAQNASGSVASTGWLSLDMGAAGSTNFWCAVVGGSGNIAASSNGGRAAVIGGSLNRAINGSAVVVGGSSNTADATFAGVLAGQINSATGSNAVVVGGQSNTASGTQAAVIGGNTNTASAINCVVVGGSSNTANVNSSACLGGAQNTASGIYAAVVGGVANTANAEASSIIGGGYGTVRSVIANQVRAAYAPISSTPVGASQVADLILGVQTTDATGTTIRSTSSAASTTNQLILPNNSAFIFQGTLVANVTGGGNSKAWKFEGLVKRGVNAASTALVAGVSPTVIAQNAGASAWTMSVSADTSNGGVQIMVFGAAATTIRWVCRIQTTEVTF